MQNDTGTAGAATLEDLVERARGLTQTGRRALLGITGSPGAGKSTLAVELVRRLGPAPPAGGEAGAWVAYVPMDGFHLADAELDRLGRRGRKGAPDTFDADGYAALLHRLGEELTVTVYAPAFDRRLEQPVAGSIPVDPAVRLVVTEGNYLLLDEPAWTRARRQLDEVWFCDLADADRLDRLVARHERFGKPSGTAAAWVRDVDQPNADLVAATRDRADLVIPAALLERIGAPEAP